MSSALFPGLVLFGIECSIYRSCTICRVGQNRTYTPYMTVCLVISLPKIPYIHRKSMVLGNPRASAWALLVNVYVKEPIIVSSDQ